MNKYLHILFTLIFSIAAISVFSADTYYNSSKDGYWNSVTTWGGTAPGYSVQTKEHVTINSNDTVTSSASIEIKGGAYLTIKSNATLIINGNVTFFNGSYILIETGGRLIINGNMTNNNNSNNVVINGSMNTTGTFDNGTGGEITGTGQVTAAIYTGDGFTFNYANDEIPAGTTVSSGSLPVELLFFKFQNASNSIILKWATASETNNDFFTIERSEDGVNFKEIGIISGSGNTNEMVAYTFTDKEPIQGMNYYRLKQTDFDGKYKYVGLVSGKFITDEKQIIFENPVHSDNFNVTLTSEGIFQINIFNYNGQNIYSTVIETASGFSSFKIPENLLSKGVYLLNLYNSSGNSTTYKVVVE